MSVVVKKLLFSIIAVLFMGSLFGSLSYSDDLIVIGNGHAPMYLSNTDSGRFDFDHDGTTDYFVKAHYTGNSHQPLKIDYKLQDECVDLGPKDASDVGGDTFDDAALKVGLTTKSRQWLVDDVIVWNPWFKSGNNDSNQEIDLVILPPVSFSPFDDDTHGDDAIQGSKKHGSFQHFSSIKELDGQSGWSGSVFLNAPQGEYIFWTIHPGGGYGGCDGLTGLGIPITITK